MSTKIHHGWRVRHPSTVRGLVELTQTVNMAFKVEQQRLFTELVARSATAIADAAAAGLGEPRDSTALTESLTSMYRLKTEAERSSQRSPFDLSVSITFLDDPEDTDWLYALLFAQVDYYQETLTELGFERYPYWDNTDRPDDLTDQEWAQRRALWDRIVGWDTPASRGLTWSLSGLVDLFPDDAALGEALQSINLSDEARLRDRASAARRHDVDPATLPPLEPLTVDHLRRPI